MKILFVCTGNTCRSPMAEAIMKELYKDIEVSSAGLSAIDGDEISKNSFLVLKDLGIDYRGHKAKRVNQSILDSNGLIIVMSSGHRDRLLYEYNIDRSKVFTILELAYGIERDVLDPYGQGYDIYIKTRDEIKGAIEMIIENIKKLQENKKIGIGSDHGGYGLKEEIKGLLDELELEYVDYGTNSEESVDYPEYGKKVANGVMNGEVDSGIVICGTGIGISLAANKVKGIRCALCSDTYSARMSKNHNNANMLALGARVLGIDLAKEIVKAWLSEEFQGGRHERRVDKIED